MVLRATGARIDDRAAREAIRQRWDTLEPCFPSALDPFFRAFPHPSTLVVVEP